ncbi:MAG: hypothetical protein ACTSRP_20760, partial [Candidatus Helarchaeota archaeon]
MASIVIILTFQYIFEDSYTKYAYYSTAKKATKDRKEWGGRRWYSTSAWSARENDFYFDIDDDLQKFDLRVRLYLRPFGDYSDFAAKLFDKTFGYNTRSESREHWKKEDKEGD